MPAAHPLRADSSPPAADRNVALFVAFRILFNARFYYPVFMVMFLDFGISVEEFGILNAVWAAAIVLLEVPSGALADLVGRRRLLVAGAILMVCEMLVLCLVPVPSSWVLPALIVNRILSGAAEAFVSGADEALAFDSLQAHGRSGEWPRVLERLMKWGGLVTVVVMITGSLLYDPGPLNALAAACGLPGGLTHAETFRLPVWLTLGFAVAAVGAALAMREPPRVAAASHPGGTGLAAPFLQTAATGRWILSQPLVLVVIVAGVLLDQPIRQVLVVSSEIYRQIGVPERFFGLISAGSAVVGLLTAAPMRRLALARSPRFNVLLLAVMTLVGLAGTVALVPVWSIAFYMLLSVALRLVAFLQSHYLNQLTDSARRATVLSFRGLAVNIGYGLMSLGFAAAVAGIERSGSADPTAGADSFRAVLAFLPWYFALAAVVFFVWSRRLVGGSGLATSGGFRQGGSDPEVGRDGHEEHDADHGVGREEGVVDP
jgi:MFS family permease